MKNFIKWVLIVLLLTAVISGAMVLYEKLSEEYSKENIAETPQEEESFAAPDFEVLDENGNKVSLSDFKGKPVVINFWTTWCYYCEKEMPDFNKAYENYPDVQFMMINATDGERETVSKAKAYIEDKGYSFDVFYDTELSAVKNYYVSAFPATFFIDKNGNLVLQGKGALDYETLIKGIEMIQ